MSKKRPLNPEDDAELISSNESSHALLSKIEALKNTVGARIQFSKCDVDPKSRHRYSDLAPAVPRLPSAASKSVAFTSKRKSHKKKRNGNKENAGDAIPEEDEENGDDDSSDGDSDSSEEEDSSKGKRGPPGTAGASTVPGTAGALSQASGGLDSSLGSPPGTAGGDAAAGSDGGEKGASDGNEGGGAFAKLGAKLLRGLTSAKLSMGNMLKRANTEAAGGNSGGEEDESTYAIKRRREARAMEAKLKQLASENMSLLVDSIKFDQTKPLIKDPAAYSKAQVLISQMAAAVKQASQLAPGEGAAASAAAAAAAAAAGTGSGGAAAGSGAAAAGGAGASSDGSASNGEGGAAGAGGSPPTILMPAVDDGVASIKSGINIVLPLDIAMRHTAARIVPGYSPKKFGRHYLSLLAAEVVVDCFWLVHCRLFQSNSQLGQEYLLQSLGNLHLRLNQSLVDKPGATSKVSNNSTAKAAVATKRSRARFAFLGALPWAVADTVCNIYQYFVAGSRALYTERFRLEASLIVARVMCGVEVAPVTVISTVEKMFPDWQFAARTEISAIPAVTASHEMVLAIERRAAKSQIERKKRESSKEPGEGGGGAASAPSSPSKPLLADGGEGGASGAAASPGSPEAGGGGGNNSNNNDGGIPKVILNDPSLIALSKTLGYRSVYDLYKTTTVTDRDLLGLHDAYQAEALRSLAKGSILPASAFHAAAMARMQEERAARLKETEKLKAAQEAKKASEKAEAEREAARAKARRKQLKAAEKEEKKREREKQRRHFGYAEESSGGSEGEGDGGHYHHQHDQEQHAYGSENEDHQHHQHHDEQQQEGEEDEHHGTTTAGYGSTMSSTSSHHRLHHHHSHRTVAAQLAERAAPVGGAFKPRTYERPQLPQSPIAGPNSTSPSRTGTAGFKGGSRPTSASSPLGMSKKAQEAAEEAKATGIYTVTANGGVVVATRGGKNAVANAGQTTIDPMAHQSGGAMKAEVKEERKRNAFNVVARGGNLTDPRHKAIMDRIVAAAAAQDAAGAEAVAAELYFKKVQGESSTASSLSAGALSILYGHNKSVATLTPLGSLMPGQHPVSTHPHGGQIPIVAPNGQTMLMNLPPGVSLPQGIDPSRVDYGAPSAAALNKVAALTSASMMMGGGGTSSGSGSASSAEAAFSSAFQATAAADPTSREAAILRKLDHFLKASPMPPPGYAGGKGGLINVTAMSPSRAGSAATRRKEGEQGESGPTEAVIAPIDMLSAALMAASERLGLDGPILPGRKLGDGVTNQGNRSRSPSPARADTAATTNGERPPTYRSLSPVHTRNNNPNDESHLPAEGAVVITSDANGRGEIIPPPSVQALLILKQAGFSNFNGKSVNIGGTVGAGEAGDDDSVILSATNSALEGTLDALDAEVAASAAAAATGGGRHGHRPASGRNRADADKAAGAAGGENGGAAGATTLGATGSSTLTAATGTARTTKEVTIATSPLSRDPSISNVTGLPTNGLSATTGNILGGGGGSLGTVGSEVSSSTVNGHKGAPSAEELVTKMLINRSKKRPLIVPFAYTATSTLLTRAIPDVHSAEGGQTLAIGRTIPVPWARYGGVDTFRSSSGKPSVRSEVQSVQKRIQETVRALNQEGIRVANSAIQESHKRREELMTAGPVKVARAALEVRQERMKRLQAKAVESQQKRMQRQIGRVDGPPGAGGPGDGGDSSGPIFNEGSRGGPRDDDDDDDDSDDDPDGLGSALPGDRNALRAELGIGGVGPPGLSPAAVESLKAGGKGTYCVKMGKPAQIIQ
jgi:hypothetical protein